MSSYAIDFEPPRDFRPKQLPPVVNAEPAPPRWLKYQVYTDAGVFATIDEHAIKVALSDYDDFNSLIYNLVYSKNFSQLERLRLIYRWLTTKNMQTITFRNKDVNHQPGSPEDILVGFRHRRSTYSKVFETMCLAAGIPCVLVSGVAKGVEYRPGVTVAQYRTGSAIQQDQRYNHSWNAVFIENSWQLIDAQWGTRCLQTTADVHSIDYDEALIYEYDDFYFMPDPSHLIYSHFPSDHRWQLMPTALDFHVFQNLPLAKSHFFVAELQFWSHNIGVIKCPNGSVKIRIGYSKPVGFTYKVFDCETLSQVFPRDGTPLNRYVLQEVADGIANYYIKLPYAGSFYFSIFVQRLDEMDPGQPAIYNAACEFKIIADRAATGPRGQPLEAYPEVDAIYGYGSSLYYYQYGLVPSMKAGVIQTSTMNNDFQISFAKNKDSRMYFRLRSLKDQEELQVDIRDTNQLAKAMGRIDENGEYVLEVYANDPNGDGNNYTHIGQYLIINGPVDLPDFKAGPPQSLPAGIARYPDTYELQTDRFARSKLSYTPSQAANSLPSKTRKAAKQNKVPDFATVSSNIDQVLLIISFTSILSCLLHFPWKNFTYTALPLIIRGSTGICIVTAPRNVGIAWLSIELSRMNESLAFYRIFLVSHTLSEFLRLCLLIFFSNSAKRNNRYFIDLFCQRKDSNDSNEPC